MGSVRKIVQISFLLSLAWIGCVRDPQDIPAGMSSSDPVFGFTGILGNEAVNVQAGINEWTMQPLINEENAIVAYTSVFSKNACLDQCTPSFEFRFYENGSPSANLESDFLQTIKTGQKDLVKSHQERDSFEITVNTQPGLFMSGYSFWQNLNGSITSQQVEFRDVVGYGEFLDVCFQSLAYTGCQYSQCIHFNPATLIPCIASIHAKYEDDQTVSVNVNPEMGTPPFRVVWFDSSTTQTVLLYHQDNKAEFYVGVTVTDALGNRAELNQSLRIQDAVIDPCYFPISLISTAVPNISSSTLDDKVEIIYTDEDGIEWSSSSGVQQMTPICVITDVQYFGLSPSHQPAYKVVLNVSVQVFNAAGQAQLFQAQGATMALSHL
ncbi:MAG: hypothetical protein ABIQ02_09405 [Saprospiraceae bacterium]